MRRAAAVVTDTGGMTCHAAIVSRELASRASSAREATSRLRDGELVTVDAPAAWCSRGPCSAGDRARRPAPPRRAAGTCDRDPAPREPVRALAGRARRQLDVDGVGLLRAEMMVLEALEGGTRDPARTRPGGEFVERMTEVSPCAPAFARRPITYRTIDFRTNEFRGLEGGERFEPQEANPMIGYRGASRYVREPDLFRLELKAIQQVWDGGGTNLHMMLPFVRTPESSSSAESRSTFGPSTGAGSSSCG